MSASVGLAWLASLVLSLAPAPPSPAPPSPAPAEPSPAPSAAPVEVPAPSVDPSQVEAALARLPPGPSLKAVQDAALRQASLDPAVASRWLRQARVAAALPTLSIQYDHRLDRGWTLDREAGQPDALRSDAGSQGVIRAKATWELDRLIFSPDELRAARAVLDLAELRERVLIEITQLYYDRIRLLLERELASPSDLDSAIMAAVRLREVEGLLAGLTGLEF